MVLPNLYSHLSVFRISFSFFPAQDEFMVVDGKAKTKGRERRVFLFQKIIIFSEPMTREGGLPEFRYMHSMKVNICNSKWLSGVLSIFLLVEACK